MTNKQQQIESLNNEVRKEKTSLFHFEFYSIKLDSNLAKEIR